VALRVKVIFPFATSEILKNSQLPNVFVLLCFCFCFLWSCTEGESKSFFLGGDFCKYRYWQFTQKTIQEEESYLIGLVVLAFLTE